MVQDSPEKEPCQIEEEPCKCPSEEESIHFEELVYGPEHLVLDHMPCPGP